MNDIHWKKLCVISLMTLNQCHYICSRKRHQDSRQQGSKVLLIFIKAQPQANLSSLYNIKQHSPSFKMPESMSVPWAWVIPVYFPWNLCLRCLLKCNFRIRTSDLGRALVRLRQQPPLLSWFQSCIQPTETKQKAAVSLKWPHWNSYSDPRLMKLYAAIIHVCSTQPYSAPSLRFYWEIWQYE